MNTPESPALDRRAFSIPEACKVTGIGRTLLYREMQEGRLKVTKIGRRTVIRKADLDAWLQSL